MYVIFRYSYFCNSLAISLVGDGLNDALNPKLGQDNVNATIGK